ncbi:MAG: 3-isopropylmalate dehydratase large subunit [Kofleriaceae bacterium]|nr:3-isopropylmalate dehydratase large subunit [Kofleriaceae bacterium]MCL4223389.1 3-isopropylmalate dehydratase large subunit [Myxococcales bacterium]
MSAPRGPRTLFARIWDDHVVHHDEGAPAILAIDLHLVHEVTSPQAFAGLASRGLGVRRPERTVATMDHSVPTVARGGAASARGRHEAVLAVLDEPGRAQLDTLAANCAAHGVRLFGMGSEQQGIVHVIGPELGLTHPGMTIVCGDSHTSTHGAFGALAFGIGTSEVEHVLATQCLLQRRPRTMRVTVDGVLPAGVTAKDVILAFIARVGTGGATGFVLEYAGRAIRALDMEARMTVCNMSIEGGARAGLIAPDDTTFGYLAGRPHAPAGAAWERAVARWRTLATDDGAGFDAEVHLDGGALEPMITYGTNPGMGGPVGAPVPDPAAVGDADARAALRRALDYMQVEPGKPLLGRAVDVVFVGSCTNGRLSDLRTAASVLRGRKVAPGVRALIVPGSEAVARAAEAEGLDQVFTAAGAEWRTPGCSMCIAMNGDQLRPGQLAVSTSNRNFEGRQGQGGRTLLASPLTAAAAAVTGRVTDPRTLLEVAA